MGADRHDFSVPSKSPSPTDILSFSLGFFVYVDISVERLSDTREGTIGHFQERANVWELDFCI